MLIKKKKKYELNGDVVLVFKENGKCLKLQEVDNYGGVFFFYEKLGRLFLMISEFMFLVIILFEEFCIDFYDKLFMVNVQ